MCIVHCVKMHYFLLNIKHGTSQLYSGAKYNCEAPGEGPRRGEGRASLRHSGEGPLSGPRGPPTL